MDVNFFDPAWARALRDAVRETVGGELNALAAEMNRAPGSLDSAIANLGVPDSIDDAHSAPRIRLHAHQLIWILIRRGPDRFFRTAGPWLRRVVIPLPTALRDSAALSYGERLNEIHDRVSFLSGAVQDAIDRASPGGEHITEAEHLAITDAAYAIYVETALLSQDIDRAAQVPRLRPVPGGKA